ncbi:hypothetical protein CXG81DRAFT_7165, partial [Caulochytrium protostelioides]
ACKAVTKAIGSVSGYEQLQREIEILKKLRHRHAVQVLAVYETSRKVYMVMEYCAGGELLRGMREAGFPFDLSIIQLVIVNLLDVLKYLHDHGIVHRDIKPENILLHHALPQTHRSAAGGVGTALPDTPMYADRPLLHIKLSDFGLATYTTSCTMMDNVVGTPLYMAPEIVQNLGYSAGCDVWSVGVMLYLLLTGYARDTERLLHGMIQNGTIEYPDKIWSHVPPSARDLVQQMLQIDPAQRITAREALSHPW